MDLVFLHFFAVQILKKEGIREVPAESSYSEQVENPAEVTTVKQGLYKESFKF